jgi:serine/threonine-protein kinase
MTVCPLTGKILFLQDDYARPPLPEAPASRVPRAPRRPSSHPPPRSEGKTAIASLHGLLGRTIDGKYIVRSVLGEGGMGTVYEAEHITLGRAVAVKVLHPQQARKKVAVKRFHMEARAAGAIGHPNICEVYDLGTLDDGSPYLVMERLVGRTLADRIANEGGLPFDDVIDIMSQVLAGLIVAHEKGIVHRDIKPENIFLVDRPGFLSVAKLLDFGVSKVMSPVMSGEREEDMDLTRTGMVMGTPFYMSPEQARGDRDLDGRVDLYACGVMLYEALTGRRPFLAANYNALLLQILTTTPRPVRELRPALPLGFDRVLDKALKRDRLDRYQSALEFQREMLALKDRHGAPGSHVPAPPPSNEIARQSFGGIRPSPPSAPRAGLPSGSVGARRLREIVPLPGTPSSVEIHVDFQDESARQNEGRDMFDDMPTEVTRDPRFYQDANEYQDPNAYRDPNEYDSDGGETEVRQDALELLREARTGIAANPAPARQAGPAGPASPAGPAVSGFTDDERTTQLDGPDDLTEIIRDARDLRKKRRP